MKKIGFLVCLFLIGAVSLAAQTPNSKKTPVPAAAVTTASISPAKEASIRRLLEVSGAKGVAISMMDSMEQSIRPMMTSALPPGDYRERLVELFFQKFHERRDPQVLIDMAVPAYDKYFTEDEIKGLVAFYESPLGKKAVGTLPKLTGEMQQMGGEWGRKMGQECMTEVLKENPDLAKAVEEAANKAKSSSSGK
ncbi:MAG TPA: DUF2059 domain-containing protein [Terriglobales bacterium]|nr:DUF2059 domain-containing protein [Terriglobales bacterium]